MNAVEEMKLRIIWLIVLSAVFSGTVNVSTTMIPSVRSILVNETTFFNCSTSSDNVEWLFSSDRFGQSFIYSYGTVKPHYKDRFHVENSTHSFGKLSNLILHSVTQDDAGRYTCRDAGSGNEDRMEMHLIVLDALGEYSEKNATLNDKEKCSVNSSQPCNYIWKFNDSKEFQSESHGQNIDLTSSGSYICEAICPMMDTTCTIIVKKVVVSPQSPAMQNVALILGIAVPLAIIITAAVIASFICKRCRKRRSKPAPTLFDFTVKVDENLSPDVGDTLLFDATVEIDENLLPDDSDTLLFDATVEIYENLLPDDSATQHSDVPVELNNPSSDAPDIVRFKRNCVMVEKLIPAETKIKGNRIRGLTLLNQELFVATEGCNKVEVYDSASMAIKKTLAFKGLLEPGTMASCIKDNCIYLIDKRKSHSQEIIKFSPDGKSAKRWSGVNSYGRLSVIEKTGHVVLAAYQTGSKHVVNIFSANGKLIITMDFTEKSNIVHLWHAVKLKQGGFLVSHGSDQQQSLLHRVCKLGKEKNITKSFGKEKGPNSDRLHDPSCLAETANESILVTDMKNNRVLLLSKHLEFKKVLFTQEDGIHLPETMFFDETNKRLYVGCNLETGKDGRVIRLPCTIE